MSRLDAVGWLLVAVVGAPLVFHFLKRPSSIEIEADGIRTKGLLSWSDQEHFLFADIRRFEERYSKPLLAREGSWLLYAVTMEDGREMRHPLPNFSSVTFSALKKALTDWQTTHGCLQPLPFADMSEMVRY